MTRGKIATVFDDKMLVSVEFNGDMYVEDYGHGREVLDNLESINTEQEYRDFIEAFDSENFNYATESKQNGENYFDNKYYKNGVEVVNFDREDLFDFQKDYFGFWFSDYIYIKNLGKDLFIKCTIIKNEKILNAEVKIETNGIIVLNFGALVEQYSVGYEILSTTEIENEEDPLLF